MKKSTVLALAALGVFAAASGFCAEDSVKSRFFPSMLDTVNGQPVDLTKFRVASACGECHPTQHGQWMDSMHAQSFKDPFYRAVLAQASKEGGPEMDRLCTGCHTPIGTLAEFVWVRSTGEVVSNEFVNEGITCDVCHSIASIRHPKKGEPMGNAAFLVDTTGTKYGPYDDAYSDFHPTKFSQLHTQSDFCASCHNIYHPGTKTNIARTYDEWRDSVYEMNGIMCQDCHMVPPALVVPIADNLKKPNLVGSTSAWDTIRTPFYPHNFTGANVAVPILMGLTVEAADAKALLQSAAEVGVKIENFDPAAKTLAFSVSVRNERAGHNLPTGMTEIRQMWTEIEVRDISTKKTLWHRGKLDANGHLDRDTVLYGAHGLNARGEPTWKPWEIAKIQFDNSIPPKSTLRDDHTVDVGDAKGPFLVTATLRYRSFDQKLADEYLKKEGYKVPVVVMAKGSATYAVRE